MKDLIVFLCVVAFVLIIPALSWSSSRYKAARSKKTEKNPVDLPPPRDFYRG